MTEWGARPYDYIIEIRATSPLKTTEDIDGCIERLIETGADSVIGVTALEDHHPARAKWLDERGNIRDFIPEPQSGRRQDLTPKAYVRNGTIYALKRDAVMGVNGKLFGHVNSIGYEMPAERSVNIDTELDWKLAELLMGGAK
jgi:CMP-N,N'-diacetyllegionaminic acid synthase